MTDLVLILRRIGRTDWFDLPTGGVCRVGLAEIVGVFMGRAGFRVVWLGDER